MASSGVERDSLKSTINSEIERSQPVLTVQETERIAADLYRRAGGTSVYALALAAGCTVYRGEELPAEMGALLTSDGALIVRTGCGRLAPLHELAHWLLRRVPHTMGDVGCLALALIAPR